MNAGTDSILLPGQAAWVADASRLKVMEKGRRTGVTWAEASDDVLIAASRRGEGGHNIYYFPQAKEDAIEYIETCGKWAKAIGHAVGAMREGAWEDEMGEVLDNTDPDKSIRTYRIDFASGNRIVALSSAPARARGKEGVFVLDEAAFHPNLPGVLKSVMATVLRGGRVRVISTHNGEDNPFNNLIIEIRSGRRLGTVHRYPFREAVADGMYRRICELDPDLAWSPQAERQYIADAYGMYGDDAAEELDAIPSAGGGAWLPNSLILARMAEAPVLRLRYDDAFAELPDHLRAADCHDWCEQQLAPLLAALPVGPLYHYGMDFGRTGHLSVIAPGYRERGLKLVAPFLVEMRNVPYRQQEQVLGYTIDRLPKFACGANDSRGNGQAVAEWAWQKYGKSRVEAVMLSTAWYRDNMPGMKMDFQDGLMQIPRDDDVRRDLRAVVVDKGVAKVPDVGEYEGSDGGKRHGDAAVALALLHYAATRMEPAPIEFQATGVTRGGDSFRGYVGGGGRVTDTGFGAVAGGHDFGGF